MNKDLLNALKIEIIKNKYHLQNGTIEIYSQNVVMTHLLTKGINTFLLHYFINNNYNCKISVLFKFICSMIPLSESIGIISTRNRAVINSSNGSPSNLSFAKVRLSYCTIFTYLCLSDKFQIFNK